MTETTIKVKGDVKNAQKEFRKLSEKIKDVGEASRAVAQKAGIAFAGLVGSIGLAVSKYGVQEKAVNSLNQSLRTQGIYSDTLSKKYQNLASAIQKYTTYGDEEIIQAQAKLQAYAGNTEITEDLTKAVVDFAAASKMDLGSAMDLVGKSIGSSTNALARYGIEIDSSATKQEKMAALTEALSKRYEGQAAAQAKGVGQIKRLSNSFGDLLEVIGKQFAPMISKAAELMSSFIDTINANAELAKTAGLFLGIATAVAGVVTAVATFLAVVPSIVAGFGLVTAAVAKLNLAFLANPIVAAVAAIVAAITGLYLAWKNNFLGIQEIAFGVFGAVKTFFSNFIENVTEMFGGLGELLVGVFTLDTDKIKAGLARAMKAVTTQIDVTAKAYQVAHDKRLKQIEAETVKRVEGEKKAAKIAAEAPGAGFALTGSTGRPKSPGPKPLTEKEKTAYKKRLEEIAKIQSEAEEKEQKRKASLVNAGLGVANQALGGRFGAKNMLGDLAGVGADMLMPGIGGAVGGLVKTLADLGPDGAKKMISQFVEAIPDLVVTVVEALVASADVIVERLITVFLVEGGLERIFMAVLRGIPKVAEALVWSMVRGLGRALGALSERFGLGTINSMGANIGSFLEPITKVFDKYVEFYSKLFEFIKSFFNSFYKNLTGAFNSYIKFWQNSLNWFIDSMTDLFNWLPEAIKKILPSVGGGGGGGGLLGGSVIPGVLKDGRAPRYLAEGWTPKWPDTELSWFDPRERILSNADNKTVIKGINSILSKVSGGQNINLQMTFKGDGIQEFIQKSLVEASALGTGRIQVAVGSET